MTDVQKIRRMKLRYTSSALKDLDNIGAYISRDNARAAARVFRSRSLDRTISDNQCFTQLAPPSALHPLF